MTTLTSLASLMPSYRFSPLSKTQSRVAVIKRRGDREGQRGTTEKRRQRRRDRASQNTSLARLNNTALVAEMTEIAITLIKILL